MKTIHEDEGYETAGNNGQNKLRTALNGPIVDINTSVVNSLEKSLENSANPVSGVALATPTVNAIAADCTAEATPSTSAEGTILVIVFAAQNLSIMNARRLPDSSTIVKLF